MSHSNKIIKHHQLPELYQPRTVNCYAHGQKAYVHNSQTSLANFLLDLSNYNFNLNSFLLPFCKCVEWCTIINGKSRLSRSYKLYRLDCKNRHTNKTKFEND